MPHAAAERTPTTPPRLPRTAALFLDFDGTLAPLAARPDLVEVPADLPPLLEAMQRQLGGAVAVITGRRLADVDRYLAPFTFGGAGLHGAELRPLAGGPAALQWNPDTRPLVQALTRRFGNDPRILIEDKGASVALHYRQAPERANECVEAMHTLVPRRDFATISGSMVIEARPHGAAKGRALRALHACAPFAGRVPVFVGDDVTDEDGFAACAALGGYGVKIGAGATAARYRFDDLGAFPDWLRQSLDPVAPAAA